MSLARILAVFAPLAAAWLAPSAPAPAARPQAASVVRVRIEGPLDIGTSSLLARAIRTARERGGAGQGAVLLVELDTPGGEIELMWKIAGQLDAASRDGLRTVAWVKDRALSAGVLVAMACERIYMRPEGTLGAAAPVTFGPGGGLGAIPDPTVQEKVASAVRASFRAWAESHGRPPALAEAMVDVQVGVREVLVGGERVLMTQSEYDDARMRGEVIENVRTVVEVGRLASVTGAEAVRLGMADGLASDQDELLEKIGARGASVETIARERSEDLAATLYALRWLLLLGGLAGAYLELKMPGFGLPGIASLACFGLFLFGQYLVGLADVPHIVAVVLGLALLAAEIFLLPGTLWLGLAGGALLVLGLVLALGGVGSGLAYPLDRAILFDTVFDLALWSVAALALGFWLSRYLLRVPGLDRLVLAGPGSGGHRQQAEHQAGAGVAEPASVAEKRALVGALGRALTDLRPVGKVELEGRAGADFEARTEGPALDRGARVRVVGVSSGRLVVEGAPAGSSPAESSQAESSQAESSKGEPG